MSPPVRQYSFASGEVAPSLYARTDINRYENGLRTARNMVVMRHGGLTGRPGSMYVGTTLNGGAAVRLIPFIFNETGLGQSYVLEFGNFYIAFYQNGGVVVSGGVPYKIVSPYAQADLATLQFAESADVVTIVHPNYAPRELARLGATNWTLTTITFTPSLAQPGIPVVTGSIGNPPSWFEYGVASVNGLGIESLNQTSGGQAAQLLALPTPTTPIFLNWTVATGATSYRIYKRSSAVVVPNVLNGPWGFIGTTVFLGFQDNGITPDFTNTPVINSAPFSGAGNRPSTVGFVQQRRVFANTLNNPIGFWESQPGDFYNFTTHLPPTDSDAIFASLSGEEVNAIQHLLELKFMLILTAGAEIYVQGNGTGVVTPSAINASVQSQYGCSALRPLKVGDILIFNQALGSFVRDFAFDFAIDGYRGNDISVFASHLFEGYTLNDWAYQKTPDSLIWAARSDGVLLCCTYVREQQILAWTHHDMTNGFVENVCAIPENGQYAVYLSVRRVINGATVRYIERLSSRIWTDSNNIYPVGDPINATYLDCYSSYNGTNIGATTMTLTVAGGFLTTPSAYQQQLTLTASAPYFGAGQTAQVGDQIFLMDAAWIASNAPLYTGLPGNQLKLIIQSISSSTVAIVTPEGVVPAEFQAVPITSWARAVKTLSGLGYLAGQQVSVWADRNVVGSPLNYLIKTVYTVPVSGVLTLDKCYSVIYIGLPMTQDVETLDLETYFGESLLGKRKRVSSVAAYLYNTRSFFAGGENPDFNLNNTNNQPLFQLNEMKRGENTVTYDQPAELFTDQDYVINTGRWNKNGRVFLRNVDPLPFSVLAISPRAELTAQVPPYSQRV